MNFGNTIVTHNLTESFVSVHFYFNGLFYSTGSLFKLNAVENSVGTEQDFREIGFTFELCIFAPLSDKNR